LHPAQKAPKLGMLFSYGSTSVHESKGEIGWVGHKSPNLCWPLSKLLESFHRSKNRIENIDSVSNG